MGRIDVGWLTAADNAAAITRLMARNRYSREEAKQRMASARSWENRAPAADYVFHNNGTEDAFRSEVEQVFRATVSAARAGNLTPARWHEWRLTQPPVKNEDLRSDERA